MFRFVVKILEFSLFFHAFKLENFFQRPLIKFGGLSSIEYKFVSLLFSFHQICESFLLYPVLNNSVSNP